jgi:hypothetical protein
MKLDKVTGEDMIFLIEAVIAVSTGIGTKESQNAFLNNESKVRRLVEVQDRYSTDTIRNALDSIKETIFSGGE